MRTHVATGLARPLSTVTGIHRHRPLGLAVAMACLLGTGTVSQAGMRDAASPGDSSLLFVAIDGGGDFSLATQSLVVDLGVNLSALLPQAPYVSAAGALAGANAVWNFGSNSLSVNGVASQAGNSWSPAVDAFFTGASGAVRWGVLAGDVVSLSTIGTGNTIAGGNLLVTGLPSQANIDQTGSRTTIRNAGNLLNRFIDANNALGNHALADNGANLARREDGTAYLGTTLRANFSNQLRWSYLSDSLTPSPVFLVQEQSTDAVVYQLGRTGAVADTLLAPGNEMSFRFDAGSRSLTLQPAPLPPDPNSSWTQLPSGDWHAAGNWSALEVPDRNTFATIASVGNVTVRLNGNAATVKTLILGEPDSSTHGNVATLVLGGATLTAVGDRFPPGVIVRDTGVIIGPGVINGTVQNLGTLRAVDGTLVVTGPLSNAGRIEVQRGSLSLPFGGVLANGGVLVLEGGALLGGLNNQGRLQLVGGGNRINGRAVSLTGMAFEIGGGSDPLAQLVVDGELVLGGALVLGSGGSFIAQAGQHFDLFDAGRLTGQFSAINTDGLQLAAGTRLDVSQLYTTGEVAVVAVPEPGTWALLLGGLACIGWRLGGRRGLQRT